MHVPNNPLEFPATVILSHKHNLERERETLAAGQEKQGKKQ